MYAARWLVSVLMLLGVLVFATAMRADEPSADPVPPPEPAADTTPADPSPANPAPADQVPPLAVATAGPTAAGLSVEQRRVSEKFRELREKLMHMADLMAATNPRQAVLLRQAVAKSNDLEIEDQFSRLVELIKKDQLALGVKGQQDVQESLSKILDLLLSEDRSKRLESEKARIRAYLKQINILIKEQRGLQGQTIGDADAKEIAGKQGKLADQAEELAKQIEKNEGKQERSPANRKEGPSDKPGDKNQGNQDKPGDKPSKDNPADKPKDEQPGENKSDEGQPGDKESSDKQPSEKQPSDKQPGKDGDGKPEDKPQEKPSGDQRENKPGEPGKESKPQEGNPPQPGDSQPNSGDQPQSDQSQSDQSQSDQNPAQQEQSQQNPTQRRVEEARRKMQQAQEKLEQAQRSDAKEKQQEALEELAKAKAELEAILRQLREEEQGQTLKMLEARFSHMLKLQNEVYEGTKRVDKVPEAERDQDDEIEAGRLSRKEAEIVAEADKCLALLHEEPTTVAFPEAVSDMRDQMQQVVVRLAQSKVGELTQGMEQDIIQALEEMIAAFKKAQKDRENKKNTPPPGQMPGGEVGEPPLVGQLEEIKMIRALQMRVNQRTQRYTDIIKTEQAEIPELISAIRQLGEREERIRRVTRDIVKGKNQ